MEGVYRHFTLEERRTLFRLVNAKLPVKEIAGQLGRHRSTIYREIARRFTAEFKAQTVKRLLEGGKGLSEVVTELGLSPGQLSLWRNEHLVAGSAEALAQRKAEQAELQRLKRENKRLEEEVEILKKAAAFFARGIA